MEIKTIAIIAAGLLSFLLLLYLFPKCRICGKRKFRWGVMAGTPNFYYLHENAHPFNEGRVCKGACHEKSKAEERKYGNAYHRGEKFQVFSSNYRGRTGEVQGTRRQAFSSETFRDKDVCLVMLRTTAAYLYPDANALVDVNYDKGTGSQGNYRYTVWNAYGAPCRVSR